MQKVFQEAYYMSFNVLSMSLKQWIRVFTQLIYVVVAKRLSLVIAGSPRFSLHRLLMAITSLSTSIKFCFIHCSETSHELWSSVSSPMIWNASHMPRSASKMLYLPVGRELSFTCVADPEP